MRTKWYVGIGVAALAACGDSGTSGGESDAATADVQGGDTGASGDSGTSADTLGEDVIPTPDAEPPDADMPDDTNDTTVDDAEADAAGTDADDVDDVSPDAGDCVSGDGTATVEASHFLVDGLVGAITETDCTLSNGATGRCLRVQGTGAPANHEVGPFCPRTIRDTAEVAGIWIEDGEVFDVDGAFIQGLADFYDDPIWQLWDIDSGNVRVTDTQESCAAAARPDVDPEFNNYCVECQISYVDGGVASDHLIPLNPVRAASSTTIGGPGVIVGVAFNGVDYDPPAPVAAILGAYTIAAFDDCGGHVNLGAGYHYHAATGCAPEVSQCDGHAPLIGYALDGFGLYATQDEDGFEPLDLDACRGHEDIVRGYHYHVASPGSNSFIPCLSGVTATTTGGGGGGGGMTPVACDSVPAGRPCCGDGVCDGPETAGNCTVDCR